MKKIIFVLCLAPFLFFSCGSESSKFNQNGRGDGKDGGDVSDSQFGDFDELSDSDSVGGAAVSGYNCATIHRCVKHCDSDVACRAECIEKGSGDGAKRYNDLISCIDDNCMFLSEEKTAECINEECASELNSCDLEEADSGSSGDSGSGDSGYGGDSGADSGDSGYGGDSGSGNGDSGADSGDSGYGNGDSGSGNGDSGADSGDSGSGDSGSIGDSGDKPNPGDSGGEPPECGPGSATPCLDSTSGLMWSAESSSDLRWSYATSYCNGLTEGGFSDWRLPTIRELRTLIRNCPSTMTNGSCEVTDSCLNNLGCKDYCGGCSSDYSGKYSLFGDTSYLWSSSPVTDLINFAWHVDFHTGDVNPNTKEDYTDDFARCVRNR